MSNPLSPEDFNLAPDEVEDLVKGAQSFLAPAPDPSDDDRLSEVVPVTPE